MKNIIYLIVIVLFSACAQEKKPVEAENKVPAKVQESQVVTVATTFEEVAKAIEPKNGETVLVNFWASWCKPCVAELPYFQRLSADPEYKNIRHVYISLDFLDSIEGKLKTFLINTPLPGDVIVLGDPDINKWAEDVDKDWDGAIPVTLLLKGNKKTAHLTSFENFEDLKEFINKNK